MRPASAIDQIGWIGRIDQTDKIVRLDETDQPEAISKTYRTNQTDKADETMMHGMHSSHDFSRIAARSVAALATAACALTLGVAPAQAASDTNLSGVGGSGSTSAVARSGRGNASTGKTIGNQSAWVSNAADAPKDAMPDNPSQKLPDKVSAAVPDDATVVSKDLAVTSDGQVKDLRTGQPVTDPKLVGTKDKQPDPLAKTGGRHFIPVEASRVKQAVEQNGGDANAGGGSGTGSNAGSSQGSSSSNGGANGSNAGSAADDGANAGSGAGSQSGQGNDLSGAQGQSSQPNAQSGQSAQSSVARQSADRRLSTGNRNGIVRNVALTNGGWGAYWGNYNGTQAFFKGDGSLFAQQAKGVVDVSYAQGYIDWQTAKNNGVEGAIIRIAYGQDNGYDDQALRNISECKRLGIPFGIYLYSYAYNDYMGAAEGSNVVNLLRGAGVSPGDLSYPIYYDLENWTWAGHAPPTSPYVYDGIVNNFFMQVQLSGYGNVSVYSYAGYLEGALNSNNIHSRTNWVASYGSHPGVLGTYGWRDFNFPNNYRGWQYADNGNIPGIGTVDMDVFGNYNAVDDISLLWVVRDEDIAVGAAVTNSSSNIEYKWQSYDVNTHIWKDIADWNSANWAGWEAEPGDYWLHLEVRDGQTHRSIGTRTIAFHYTAGSAAITGTYAGWNGNGILLGMNSNDSRAGYKIKIYDYNAQKWIECFNGQWANWHPRPGVYWTHFELYTPDGRKADTRTYAFGV
ncbi:GH25 family lysozyme [Bifidobacterium sp. ESL0763]|uniref:GH25 family lysozyme n=1 Tax=Bifidobacterium sp. ESL0763 TaxID=2983227 RepID=UPI0023FA4590|nr:GH25 family lysozyme [Bifidobacterium sp. ESL0763]MDF7663227.1 GH25 family lysozyme [Bifidobacterium sp. ESL0763]